MHNVFIIKLFVFMLLVLVTSSWLIPVHRTVPLVDRQNPSTRAISVLPDPFVLLLEVKITQSRCLKVFFFTSLLVYGLFTNLMIHATMIFQKMSQVHRSSGRWPRLNTSVSSNRFVILPMATTLPLVDSMEKSLSTMARHPTWLENLVR